MASLGRHAESREVIVGYEIDADIIVELPCLHVAHGLAERRNLGDARDVAAAPELAVITEPKLIDGALSHQLHLHEVSRLSDWQLGKQHRIQQAEDRCRRADAEGKRQNRAEREDGRTRQHARCVAGILTRGIDDLQNRQRAQLLFERRNVADGAARRLIGSLLVITAVPPLGRL